MCARVSMASSPVAAWFRERGLLRWSALSLIVGAWLYSALPAAAGAMRSAAAFEENRGQVSRRARYLVRGPQGAAFFAPDGVTLDLRLSGSRPAADDGLDRVKCDPLSRRGGAQKRCAVRMIFARCSSKCRLEPGETLPGQINYLKGPRPSWITGVRRYSGVKYRDVWPGIDVEFAGDGRSLKYDVVVHPGADPSRIALRYEGADSVTLEQDGSLALRAAGSVVRERIPAIYQQTPGGRVAVDGGYRIIGDREVGFRLGRYDPSRPLVIDPAGDLVWSTFLGGSETDEIRDVGRDSAGSLYVAGYSESANFPATPGAYDTGHNGEEDAFVAKFNSTGTQLVYATYVGGESVDAAYCIAVNPSSGVACFGGNTYSPDFPVASGAYDTTLEGEHSSQGFVAALNTSGNALVCCAFLGGSEDDYVIGIDQDSSGNIYAAGYTLSADFPVKAGSYDTVFADGSAYADQEDAFVTKLDPSGSTAFYSTFLGHAYRDEAYGVIVDGTGTAWVCGLAGSDGFPVTASTYDSSYDGGGDAFVTRLNAAGTSLLYSTFLGGSGRDDAIGIARGQDGSIYVGGRTQSTDFPATPGALQESRAGDPAYANGDAFLAKFHPTGLWLEYATYIGGTNSDHINCVAVDAAGYAYASGVTTSYTFPVTPGAFSTSNSSLATWNEGFLLKVNLSGSALIYSTYIGTDDIDYAYCVVADGAGGVYAGGATRSEDFPVTAGAYDTSIGFVDGWLMRLSMPDWAPPSGSVVIDDNDVYCTSIVTALTVDADDNDDTGSIQMRFSNNNVTYTPWEALSDSRSWNLTSGDGLKTVYAQFKDASGNVSDTITDSIILETEPPLGSIVVNSGAASTTTLACTLALWATDAGMGVAAMRFSNDGGSWSSWLPYAATADWTLAAGDGTKTVYTQFRDGAGRMSPSYTDTIVLDQTPPAGSVVINDYANYTLGTSVALTVWATDPVTGVALMRFSNDGQTWSTWEGYSATPKAWTLPTGDGIKTVYAQYKDWAGNTSQSFTDTIVLDQTAPTGGVAIAAGLDCVPSTGVTLDLPAQDEGTGVQSMRLRNAGDAWSAWENYSATRAWTLTAGDGLKTVEVQFKDGAAKQSVIYSDTAMLDTVAPAGSLSANGKAEYCNSRDVELSLEATDAGCGVSEMRFLSDSGRWLAWEAFAAKRTWTLGAGDGEKTVTAQFRDPAGNVSASAVDTITLDTASPTGSIAINGGAQYACSSTVGLALAASDTLSGVSEMRLRNSLGIYGAWQPYLSSPLWQLVPGDGNKTVVAQYRDRAGNMSLEASDSIVLDATAPTGSVHINGDAAFSTVPSVTLTIGASDALSGLDGMQLSNDGSSWTSWQAYAAGKAWTLDAGDGPRTVYVRFRDAAGNVCAPVTDIIVVGQPVSLAEARMRPSGDLVILANQAVSAAFADATYLLDAQRACGLRVAGAIGASPGDAADVAGTLAVLSGEKSLEPLTWAVTSVASVRPVGIRLRYAGGADWLYSAETGAGQQGVTGGVGLNNIGLLVTTCGRITIRDASSPPGWFVIDDGSGASLKCSVPAGVTIGPGWSFAIVTGVVTCAHEGPDLLPMLRVRRQADIAAF